jgi:signal peptidase II
LAGGLGNLIDRLAYGGYVVDFVNIGIGPLRTGVFNVADVGVVVGALMLFTGIPRTNKRLSER